MLPAPPHPNLSSGGGISQTPYTLSERYTNLNSQGTGSLNAVITVIRGLEEEDRHRAGTGTGSLRTGFFKIE